MISSLDATNRTRSPRSTECRAMAAANICPVSGDVSIMQISGVDTAWLTAHFCGVVSELSSIVAGVNVGRPAIPSVRNRSNQSRTRRKRSSSGNGVGDNGRVLPLNQSRSERRCCMFVVSLMSWPFTPRRKELHSKDGCLSKRHCNPREAVSP